MLIVSLAFSVFIFFNFQNVLYSDSMDVLMDYKKDYIDMIVKAASVVFAVFLFFFIWYASNVGIIRAYAEGLQDTGEEEKRNRYLHLYGVG